MRTLLLTLLSTSTAQAAVFTVPSVQASTIADAVALADASPGVSHTIILVKPEGNPTFTHIIDQQIVIPNNHNYVIRAEFPPREITDPDHVDDVVVTLDVLTATANDPTFSGAFKVGAGAQLTFENIRFKQPESHCDDDKDNDGNGVMDKEDPYCLALAALGEIEFETGFSPVPVGGGPTRDVRAFHVTDGGTLTVLRSELQGFSWGVEGATIKAEKASVVNIIESRILSALGTVELMPEFPPDPWVDYGRSRGGGVYVNNSYLTITGSRFDTAESLFGGCVFATNDSDVSITSSEFRRCAAEDGGALFIESSVAEVVGSYFVENSANLVPKGRILLREYEGGAIFSEDSDLVIRNNVFLDNIALDWSAAIAVWRDYSGGTSGTGVGVQVYNNTFVNNVPGLVGGASVQFNETTDWEYFNNISLNESAGAVGSVDWQTGQAPSISYNLFSGIALSRVQVGMLSGSAVDQNTNIIGPDPQFVFYTPYDHADWRLWRFWLRPTSPAVDTGHPDYLDVGGSRSDMGAFGGDIPGVYDDDGDGWSTLYDCDDTPPNPLTGDPGGSRIHPGAFELCDDIDNDCNGIIDDRENVYYVDEDLDGYGHNYDPSDPNDMKAPYEACPEDPLHPPPGGGVWVLVAGDCDDQNNLVNPGRPEFCDGIDNNCDGRIDDPPVRTYWLDADGDGFGSAANHSAPFSCPVPPGFSPFNDDCDDDDPTVHPLITLERRQHLPLANAPLERHEADRNPAFVADGRDQDCNGTDLCYKDADGDGYGADPITPGGEIDYIDDDGMNCFDMGALTAGRRGDCDDGDPNSHERGIEIPGDGRDQNCDGADDCYEDLDGDGFGSDRVVTDNDLYCDNDSAPTASVSGDCNDDPVDGAKQNPLQEEICDGIDNDCDGVIDEVTSPDAQDFYIDNDRDGFGDINTRIQACGEPEGWSRIAGDCNDDDPRVHPDAVEVCDGIDNNCVNGIDEAEAQDVVPWWQDLDGDGYGNPNTEIRACEAPGPNYVRGDRAPDCNDNDPLVLACPPCGCSSTTPMGGVPFGVGLLAVALARRRRSAA